MNSNFRPPTDEERSNIGGAEEGLLKVAVPHWATALNIYDTSLRPVSGIGKIKSELTKRDDGTIANIYQSEVSLGPGMYQVEAFLEGTTESHWILVQPELVTQVSEDAWKNLRFTSSAPLEETTNSRELHMLAAAKWSRKTTWNEAEGGDSSLFLFIRTLKPELYRKTFTDGLQLLSETGELITDFSFGVERNTEQGWMAFNAKLKSGGYILRRGRAGVLRRYQVIYLCDNWQTQIFLDSERFPYLQDLSVNMIRLQNISNWSFQPDDRTTLAAEAIFNFLRYESQGAALFNNDRIDILLDEKTENPWLGILAAYAIAKLKEEVESGTQNQYEEYFTLLTDKVIPFLHREIPAHPDVRALLLKEDLPAAQPFTFPPMLWQSLKKVYQHTLHFEDTVPANSLTDCLRENVIANSPWTAWRRLNRMPTVNWSKKNESLFSLKKTVDEPDTQPTAFSSILPKTPFYRLAGFEETDFGKTQIRGVGETSDLQLLINETSLIQKVKEVIKNYVLPRKFDQIPPSLKLDSAEEIETLLDKIEPEMVSQTFGLPLNQTRDGFEQLKTQAVSTQHDEPSPTSAVRGDQDLFTQKAIVQLACLKYDQKALSEIDLESSEIPRLSIKEIVGQIWTEAHRIVLKSDEIKKNDRKTAGLIKKIVKRINHIAIELLKRADFVLITDIQGRIVFCNGAFYQFISSSDEKTDIIGSDEIADQQRKQEKIWAEILVKVPVGSGSISNPKLPRGFTRWKIRRVPIQIDDVPNVDTLYLDILRVQNYSPISESDLQNINGLVSEFANFASLFSYGSDDKRDDYAEKLDKTSAKLEETMRLIQPTLHKEGKKNDKHKR
jgi:PAS domain-containing protein